MAIGSFFTDPSRYVVINSSDKGMNWDTVDLNIKASLSTLFYDNESEQILGSANSKLLKWNDPKKPESFTIVDGPQGTEKIQNIFLSRFEKNKIYLLSETKLFLSKNSGKDWTEILNEPMGIEDVVQGVKSPDLFYISGSYGIKKYDIGTSISELMNNGLPEGFESIRHLEITENGTLVGAQELGALYSNKKETGIKSIFSSPLKIGNCSIKLISNRIVSINVTKKSVFKISLYNVSGRVIEERFIQNSNKYLYELPASISEGCYFLRVKSEGDRAVNMKLILNK